MKRTKITVCIVACLAVCALAFPSTVWAAEGVATSANTSAASSEGLFANGVYTIKAGVRTSSALEVAASSTRNGGNADISKYVYKPSQHWRLVAIAGTPYYKILNANSGKALTVAGNNKASTTNVEQRTYKGAKGQKWKLSLRADGYYTITSALSKKRVLSIQGGAKANGTNVRLYTANGSRAQAWKIQALVQVLPNGYYTFTNSNSGKLLTVKGLSKKSTANIVQSKANGLLSQVFKVTYNKKTGFYTLRNVYSNLNVSVKNGTDRNGQNVRQFSVNSSSAQRWFISAYKDGSVCMRSATGGRVLKVANASTKNSANVEINKSTKSAAQKWIPKKLSSAQLNAATEKTAEAMGTTYDKLSITLDQIVAWNWSGAANIYTRQYAETKAKLRTYMDPSKCSRFQFVDLRKPSATTAAQLDAFIASTDSGKKGTLKGTGKYFVAAAKKYGLNQDYLLAHAIVETGWGTSKFALGVENNNKKYYNFFGIGAFDTNPNNAVSMAGLMGWSSPEAAIDGAAKWIASNYIYREYSPQYTLYGMKWDYLYSSTQKARGWHQYATGVQWAQGIASIMGSIYAKTGTGTSVTYIIPKYA